MKQINDLINEVKDKLSNRYYLEQRDQELVNDCVDELLRAINYSQCCTQLNGEKTPTFEEWLKMNNFEIYKNAEYKDENDCSWFSNELLKMYKRELNL